MKTSVVTASTGFPISLEDIKNHLRLEVGETNEDDLLRGFRLAAINRIEEITNRKLMYQTWKLYLDEWPSEDYINLPYTPLSAIVSTSTGIVYKNSDGDSTTFSSTAWLQDTISEPGRVCLGYNEDWPTATLHNVNPISIEFKCGYGDASSDIPEVFKLGIKLLISHYYENREFAIVGKSIDEIPEGLKALLQSQRMWSF